MEQYAELVKPYILNDLKMQRVLHDRRKVYDILQVNTGTQAYINMGDTSRLLQTPCSSPPTALMHVSM